MGGTWVAAETAREQGLSRSDEAVGFADRHPVMAVCRVSPRLLGPTGPAAIAEQLAMFGATGFWPPRLGIGPSCSARGAPTAVSASRNFRPRRTPCLRRPPAGLIHTPRLVYCRPRHASDTRGALGQHGALRHCGRDSHNPRDYRYKTRCRRPWRWPIAFALGSSHESSHKLHKLPYRFERPCKPKSDTLLAPRDCCFRPLTPSFASPSLPCASCSGGKFAHPKGTVTFPRTSRKCLD